MARTASTTRAWRRCQLCKAKARRRIEFMSEITAGRVIFGPEATEPILGVTALESVGMTVDPTTHTLRRLLAIPLKRRVERPSDPRGRQSVRASTTPRPQPPAPQPL